MYQVGTRFRAIRQESLTTVVDSVAAMADTAAVVDRAGTATAADLSVDTPGTAAAPVAAAGTADTAEPDRADTVGCMAAGMADTKSLPLPVQVNARPARHPQPSQ